MISLFDLFRMARMANMYTGKVPRIRSRVLHTLLGFLRCRFTLLSSFSRVTFTLPGFLNSVSIVSTALSIRGHDGSKQKEINELRKERSIVSNDDTLVFDYV